MNGAHSKMLFGFAAAGAGMAASGAHAQQTIIQDVFTSGSQYGTPLGAQGANSAGLAPTGANLPGGRWQHISGAFYNAKEYNGNPNGLIGNGDRDSTTDIVCFNDASDGIALGSYNAGNLHISTHVSYLMQSGHAIPPDGAYIMAGFSSALNSGSNYGPPALSTYTGLAVIGAGSLQEYVHGAPIGDPIDFKGTYSAYSDTTLMYTINTTTGGVSDVIFGNSTADYSFPVPKSFSHSYTANVAIGGAAGSAGRAAISSFILSSDWKSTP